MFPLPSASRAGMGYTLQAIVGTREMLGQAREHGLPVIELSDTLLMVPLGDEVRRRFQIPAYPLTDDSDEPAVPESLVSLCRTLYRGRLVAYLVAEFFGGVGMQAHLLCRDGVVLGSPVVREDAINQALSQFNVRVGSHHDEFAAIGLGRYRDTDAWPTQSD